MRTTIHTTDSVQPYLAAFDRLEAARRGEPAWLRAARDRAMDLFVSRGFPTTRDEDWRFTNVTPIADQVFATTDGPEGRGDGPEGPSHGNAGEVTVPSWPGLDATTLVFVDGRYAPALSSGTPARGITVTTFGDALRTAGDLLEANLGTHGASAERPFAALNTALFETGAVVSVQPGVVASTPVRLVFLAGAAGTPVAAHPRVLVVAGANSQLQLVEEFTGTAADIATFTNVVTEIVLGEGAVVDHYRIQREASGAYHVGLTHFQVGRSASASSHAVAVGARIARHDAVAVLAGQGADCTLNGLYLAGGTQLVDNHTEIDHAMPNGTSHELYKGIIDGRARGVFNGRIRVRPDAQKTDAKQTNKTLLLSDEAQINTKPQLEIFANDVKCTHGATVGQLSQEALFYLRARGIGAEDARSLLIRAFALDVLSRIRVEPVRAELDRLLASRLPGALAEKAFA
jgi:Fe-S cluster assembly protein SufD